MERVRKDYEQMRRVLQGREPASASVAILRAASATPTDAARAAGGWAALAALMAAAASTGSMPTTLRLFAVKADGLYPAAPELEALPAFANAALSQSGAAVKPLKGSYGGACLAALGPPCIHTCICSALVRSSCAHRFAVLFMPCCAAVSDLLLLRCPAGGDCTCEAGVECRSGGKAGFQVSWQEVRFMLLRSVLAPACAPCSHRILACWHRPTHNPLPPPLC